MTTLGIFMPKFRLLLVTVLTVAFVSSAICRIKGDQVTAMKSYLDKSGKEPAQYIISKFKDKDIVTIGQFNYLKHEVDFVNFIIPLLYNEGIYNLAIEYGNTEDQSTLDNLLTAQSFDEESAKTIMRNFKDYGIWGYQEYLDMFRQAWEVNRYLTKKEKKFRIVLLSQAGNTNTDKKKTMASIIEKEILSKNEKALVYFSACHSQNCIKNNNAENLKFDSYFTGKYGHKVFSIILHSPWITEGNNRLKAEGLVKPLEGAIDEVLEMTGFSPIGFDIAGSPFKNLNETKSVYYSRNNSYSLETICDGYIFLKPYSEYEALTWIPDFVNEDNLLEVRKYFRGINSELKIESTGYANDLCSSTNMSILQNSKKLKNLSFIKLDGNNY